MTSVIGLFCPHCGNLLPQTIDGAAGGSSPRVANDLEVPAVQPTSLAPINSEGRFRDDGNAVRVPGKSIREQAHEHHG